ncbi:hypothetical protein [Microtetraspora malaysiensis]|uniref:Cytochrome oxidase assembly protein n=1 Tax=Microtetraspora malaysiensis TaxID=161358 RepID=A0ABW6SXT7_9ACTN
MSVSRPWREWHRPLMANVALMIGLVVVSGVGVLVDYRTLLGESVWVKPLKFGSRHRTTGLSTSAACCATDAAWSVNRSWYRLSRAASTAVVTSPALSM